MTVENREKDEETRIEHGIARARHCDCLRYRVMLQRRGRRIERSFSDILHGGEEEALAAARAYRDAMLRAFPPYTNRELARKRHVNNISGAPGVRGIFSKRGVQTSWRAYLTLNGKRYGRTFSFRDYATVEDAFAAAVAERERWITEAEGRFRTHDSRSYELAERSFNDLLDAIAIDDSTLEGFREKLARVEQLFDEHHPRHLFVTLSLWSPQEKIRTPCLAMTVSPVSGKRRDLVKASIVRYSFGEALERLRGRLETILIKDHGPEICSAFMAEHGSMFTEEGFGEPEIGKTVHIRFLLVKPVGEVTLP